MNRRVNGYRVLVWRPPGRRPHKPRSWLPARETYYYFTRGIYTWFLHWRPHLGMWLASERVGPPPGIVSTIYQRPEKVMAIKKRVMLDGAGGQVPGASSVSILLAKLPALREFLSATSYEDGSRRAPGVLRVQTQGTLWEITIQDPEAAARLTVRGQELDKTLLLLEQLLGVEEAPWELDRYLAEKRDGKKKKK